MKNLSYLEELQIKSAPIYQILETNFSQLKLDKFCDIKIKNKQFRNKI